MIDADTIKKTILGLVGEQSAAVDMVDVAKTLDPSDWEDNLERVRLVAEVMELQGLVRISEGKIHYAGKHDTSQGT